MCELTKELKLPGPLSLLWGLPPLRQSGSSGGNPSPGEENLVVLHQHPILRNYFPLILIKGPAGLKLWSWSTTCPLGSTVELPGLGLHCPQTAKNHNGQIRSDLLHLSPHGGQDAGHQVLLLCQLSSDAPMPPLITTSRSGRRWITCPWTRPRCSPCWRWCRPYSSTQ